MAKFDLDDLILPTKSPFLMTIKQLKRIKEYHLNPINEIASSVDIDYAWCYRDRVHECKNGRRPETDTEFDHFPYVVGKMYWSEHCFLPSLRQEEGKGACDISSKDLLSLAELLLRHIPYKRFAIYERKGFIHCDYAWFDEPRFYNGEWQEIGKERYFETIRKMTNGSAVT
jgi:hypothetical protein